MKPLLVTSGEPAGIGPDICLALAGSVIPLVVMGDKAVLAARAQQLGLTIEFHDYHSGKSINPMPHALWIYDLACPEQVQAGILNSHNAAYVIAMLTTATQLCLANEFSALITAPVHKAILNQAGYSFTGHTEFLANACNVPHVVMLLASHTLRVALVTTHLPLKAVPEAITPPTITETIRTLHHSLQQDFAIPAPKILVAGLNPHAGEGGYLGREEIDVIAPTLTALRRQGFDVIGPLAADTMFTQHCDAFVAMYHDQGLAVLKYASFGEAVNITLGLPFIRTSVDHGTALELAGTGQAEVGSLLTAVNLAATMVQGRLAFKIDN